MKTKLNGELMQRYYTTLIFVIIYSINLTGLFCQVETEKIPVTINRTEVLTLVSKTNGVTYPIYIALPGSYKYSDKSYPVIYMLDAYSSFGTMVQMQRLLVFNNELPEAIIVGISSKGGSKEFIYNRARDFTPFRVDSSSLPEPVRRMLPASGGAAEFQKFIAEQLIPFVESNYRCAGKERTLVGHSLGGLFGLYTLFTNMGLFQNYVLISPALFPGNPFISNSEEEFYKSNKELQAKVYTAIGSLEPEYMIDEWQKLTSRIKSRNYNGLRLETKLAEGETHYTIIPYIATHGLKSVFNNQAAE